MEEPDLWMKLSYPFFHADRIKTPTLFMCGEKDFNVPLWAASRCIRRCAASAWTASWSSIPNQHHGITTPSYGRIGSSDISRGTRSILKPGETSELVRR